MSRYQKGKTILDFTETRDSEWQWHQRGRMQVCTSLQKDNHASTPPLKFFTDRMPFLPPNQQRQSTEVHRKLAAAIYIHHCHCYYYSTLKLILIYRPTNKFKKIDCGPVWASLTHPQNRPSPLPQSSHMKRHHDRFIRFCRAPAGNQKQTDTQTPTPRNNRNNRPYLMLCTAIRLKKFTYDIEIKFFSAG